MKKALLVAISICKFPDEKLSRSIGFGFGFGLLPELSVSLLEELLALLLVPDFARFFF